MVFRMKRGMTINNSVSDTEMTVSFRLAKADIAAFYRNLNLRIWRLVPVVLFVFIVAEIYGGRSIVAIALSVFGLTIIQLIFTWVVFWSFTRAASFSSSRRNPSGEYSIRIDTDGIHDESEAGRSSASWSGVTRIRQNSDCVTIQTDWKTAHLIPKRAFASREEADQFYEQARAFWKAAKAT